MHFPWKILDDEVRTFLNSTPMLNVRVPFGAVSMHIFNDSKTGPNGSSPSPQPAIGLVSFND